MNNSNVPTLLSEILQRVRFVNRARWFRLVISGKGRPASGGFFDEYPRFFRTSVIAAKPDRLNQRYRALIESNTEIIAGRRILDIASHDGRWSLAANKAGAEHVLGLEARSHLVDAARSTTREYGVRESQIEFLQGDALAELDHLKAGRFDTIFCFGFFYHIIDHMSLLRTIANLKPRNLILDTAISVKPAKVIEIWEEDTDDERNGAVGEPGRPSRTVAGRPSKLALELMLRATGFQPLRYYDWLHSGVQRWDDLSDYYVGSRVSLTAVRVDA